MKTARDKNKAATEALFNLDLEGQINGTTIGVIVGPTASDGLVADALGDLLGRFWRRISVSGTYAEILIESARRAAASAGEADPITAGDPCAADFVIGIGVNDSTDLNIATNDYCVSVGQNARGGTSLNPLSALVAACISASEAFKVIFGSQSRTRVIRIAQPYKLELDVVLGQRVLLPERLHLSDVAMCGVGAVSHAFLWVLERWPHTVSGHLTLADRDIYDAGNGQRYTGMLVNRGTKVDEWARRLKDVHPTLLVEPVPLDLNSYFQSAPKVGMAIAGLDSPESRRHLAVKLIPLIVNMWTSGESAGASLHRLDGIGRCLYCAYPDAGEHADEIARFTELTGLSMDRVRELLDTTEPLTASDMAVIRGKHPNFEGPEGRPLRSIVPAICSIIQVPTLTGDATTDVPLAPVSAYAGAFGFLNLLLALAECSGTPAWQSRLLAYPNENSWTNKQCTAGCVLCSNKTALELVQERAAQRRLASNG